MESPYCNSPYGAYGSSPGSPAVDQVSSPVQRTHNPLFGKSAFVSALASRDMNNGANSNWAARKLDLLQITPVKAASRHAVSAPVADTPLVDVGPALVDDEDTAEMDHARAADRPPRCDFRPIKFVEALDDSAGTDGYDEQDYAEEDAPTRGARVDDDAAAYESPAPLRATTNAPTTTTTSTTTTASAAAAPVSRASAPRTTSYIPGHDDGELTISTTLLEHIQVALELSIPLVHRRIGKQMKGKVACFSGATAVDHVLLRGYAATRIAALRLADKLYGSGVLRALQPGGFVDSKDRLYRFRSSEPLADATGAKRDGNEPSLLSSASASASASADAKPAMFSISKLLARTDDWLDASWSAAHDTSASNCASEDDRDQ